MIKIKKFVVNPLQENSYVLSDETGECVFIDPGFHFDVEKEEVLDYVKENNLTPVCIINTHCHFDHVMGVEFIRNAFKIPFAAHPGDADLIINAVEQGKLFGFPMEQVNAPDIWLHEGEDFSFGNTSMNIFHLPGHAPGHVAFYSSSDNVLISGDVLFYGSIGRTDLPGGDYNQLISGIKEKLFTLPDETIVYCGHGPETSIGIEKASNPFLT